MTIKIDKKNWKISPFQPTHVSIPVSLLRMVTAVRYGGLIAPIVSFITRSGVHGTRVQEKPLQVGSPVDRTRGGG